MKTHYFPAVPPRRRRLPTWLLLALSLAAFGAAQCIGGAS